MQHIIFGVAHGTPTVHWTKLKAMDTNCTASECEDYFKQSVIWCLTKNNLSTQKTREYLFHFIGKRTYALVKNLALP